MHKLAAIGQNGNNAPTSCKKIKHSSKKANKKLKCQYKEKNNDNK